MDPDSIDVVLVRPSRAANVAAAARALKNMGLGSLVLVSPPPDLDRPEARALAYGAWDLLDRARVVPDLRSAVAGCTLVAATSAREEGRAATRSPREFAAEAAGLAAGGRVAVVFGPEATGLLNDELALCQMRIRVPTHTAQPSLNLAQAVLLVAYELRLAALPDAPPEAPTPRALAGVVEEALDDLRDALLAINYLNPESPQLILSELRALLLRAAVTTREVSLLRGMARQIRWAGDQIALTRTGNDNRGATGGGSQMNEVQYRELRVPTSALDAEVLCVDGRTFRGRVFVPDVAATHRGPMRPAEWVNDPAPFFPFLPENETSSFLLSRSEVIVFTVRADANVDLDDPEGVGGLRRRVIVECRDQRFEGEIVMDMPSHQSRVLDYLNRPDPFLIVRDGDRHHLIRKERITRVLEPKES